MLIDHFIGVMRTLTGTTIDSAPLAISFGVAVARFYVRHTDYVVVEEMIPAAHEGGDAQFAAAVFIGGVALFTLLSVYLD